MAHGTCFAITSVNMYNTGPLCVNTAETDRTSAYSAGPSPVSCLPVSTSAISTRFSNLPNGFLQLR